MLMMILTNICLKTKSKHTYSDKARHNKEKVHEKNHDGRLHFQLLINSYELLSVFVLNGNTWNT